jgi:type VII secretion protein EccB
VLLSTRQSYSRADVLVVVASGLLSLGAAVVAAALAHPSWRPVLEAACGGAALVVVALGLVAPRRRVGLARVGDAAEIACLAALPRSASPPPAWSEAGGMASKRDLVEAQSFSRRRLLTAFTSGAPQGRELEPAKPMRGVAAGVLLTVLVLLGSIAWGILRPVLPSGWDDGSLVVVKQSGTRYVGSQGTLYPVLNVTSARLAIPSSAFHVVEAKADDVARAPRGATIGIPGAPDALPAPDRLVDDAWRACVAQDGTTAVTVGGVSAPTPAPGGAVPGVLVTSGGDEYLVAAGVRHEIPLADAAAVERALGLDQQEPVEVPAAWLTLLRAGSDLGPLTLEGAGEPVPAASGLPLDLVVGSLVEIGGAGVADTLYVVDADGALAPLTPLAAALYALGSGADVGEPRSLTAGDTGSVASAEEPVSPADWPDEVPAMPAADEAPCVVLAPTGEVLSLAAPAVDKGGVRVEPGSGALVRGAGAEGAAGETWFVDETGTAFALPGADEEVLARLGYASDDVRLVPPAWVALLPTGPALTIEAAQREARAASASS